MLRVNKTSDCHTQVTAREKELSPGGRRSCARQIICHTYRRPGEQQEGNKVWGPGAEMRFARRRKGTPSATALPRRKCGPPTRRETHPYLSMLPASKVGSRSASEHRAGKRSIVPAVQGRRGRPLHGVCGCAPHRGSERERRRKESEKERRGRENEGEGNIENQLKK